MAKISPERITAYYTGYLIAAIGVLLFLSNFFTFGVSMPRAIGGMALIVIGQAIAKVGAQGLAGSGMILDPEQARKDLKPYSHQTGGMIGDVLEKADLKTHLGGLGSAAPQQIVKIKCRDCGFLNEEDSKFCQECGSKI